MTPRFVAKQLSRPTGFLGSIIGRLMNRTNARLNAFALRQLEIAASDRILEIGFGGGATLPALIAGAAFVGGVDRSPDVVHRARTTFAKAVEAGWADFREGSVESLPFEASSFGKAYTVNTIYFWNSLARGFAEIHRVLSPGGRVVIGFLPKEHMERMKMPADVFTLRTANDVIAALSEAGFGGVHVKKPEVSTAWNVVVGTR